MTRREMSASIDLQARMDVATKVHRLGSNSLITSDLHAHRHLTEEILLSVR